MKYLAYGSRALLVTLGIALALPGCFTVGDDDAAQAGQAGEGGGTAGKGGGGTGGSTSGTGGSTGGTGGGTSGTGGTGGMCIASGESCDGSEQCCSSSATLLGYCVEGTCRDGCNDDSNCPTHCCLGLLGGGSACGPVEACCVENAEPCESHEDCCSYLAGEGYCIVDTGTCQPTCTADADCDSGCCLPIDVDTGALVCAPADFCA